MTIIEVRDRHREWYGDLIRIILSLETLAITIASRTETNSLLHVLLGVQWWARMLMNAAAIAAAFNFVLSVGVAFIDTVHRSIESGR